MFDTVIPVESRFLRWGRRTFLLMTPLVFVPFLLRPRESTIYVSDEPFAISNYTPSLLPGFFAEIVSYGYYEGTAAALLLSMIAAAIARHSRRGRTSSGVGLVWYLPAYAAGLEAMRHATLLGSRHGFTDMPSFDELQQDWVIASVASLLVVMFCVLFGVACSRVARQGTRLPLAAVAVIASVASAWFAVLTLAFGIWSPDLA